MTKVDSPRRKSSASSTTQRVLLGALVCLATMSQAQAQVGAGICGSVGIQPGQVGPYDYRNIPREPKGMIENAHFTPPVETLKAGATGPIGTDIDYTLRAIPNHHRALLSMSRYAIRQKTNKVFGARYSIECYFDRAMRFTPDDPMPHVLFASYLKSNQRPADAKRELEQAETLRGNPMTADLDYNLGILYYDLGEYDKATEAAKRAYALGAPLPALRAKLKAKGRAVD